MAYTIAQFVSLSQAGNAIMINSTYTPGPNIRIGEQPIELNTAFYDLGTYHSAVQVLDSYTLRAGIASNVINAVVGTVSLSKIPTV